jgi:hypothetical protein
VSLAGASGVPVACHTDISMLPVLFGALELTPVAVLGLVVDCAFYVAFEPYVASMAWTMLLLWLLPWP